MLFAFGTTLILMQKGINKVSLIFRRLQTIEGLGAFQSKAFRWGRVCKRAHKRAHMLRIEPIGACELCRFIW